MRGFRSVSRSLNSIARQQASLQRATLAMQRAQAREQQATNKAAQQNYLQSRAAQAEAMTAAVKKQIDELVDILPSASKRGFAVNFSKLKEKPQEVAFDSQGLMVAEVSPNDSAYMPAPLNFLARMLPIMVQKYDQAVLDGQAAYQQALKDHRQREEEHKIKLDALRATHDAAVKAEQHRVDEINTSIDATEAAYRARERDAVIEYFTLVLEDDDCFEDRTPNVRVGYVPESGQLVIETELPTIDMIPPEVGYKYIKKSDSIEPIERKVSDVRKLYRDVLSQLACRALRAVVSADVGKAVDTVVLNCFVDTIDPGTGKRITPTIISVSATMSELQDIDFSKVDAASCLTALKALVSRSAHELEAVRPIVSFNMVDPRFIDKTDVLSELDSRPNIADLTPGEFEALMTNLFEKMGLETRLTQASRDGGVDCVAWDMRPVIGGKVVIQAKRYKNTVGVSAVRDLFGTMHNEGAAKGILVTTSGFGQATYEFAKNKPIELITGSNLLSMLAEYAGVQAKIEFPQGWEDKDNLGDVDAVASPS